MEVDKIGRLISNGYSIGQSETGELFVVLKINQFTKDFLKPSIQFIPYKVYPKVFYLDKFFELENLLNKFEIDQKYTVGFAILVDGIEKAVRQNKLSKKQVSKKLARTDDLKKRLNKFEIPKSISIKFSKSESYQLPQELILDFWQAFVTNVKAHPQAENSIPIEAELSKVIYQLKELKRETQNDLIEKLIAFATGLKSDYSPEKIRKRIARQSGQKRK